MQMNFKEKQQINTPYTPYELSWMATEKKKQRINERCWKNNIVTHRTQRQVESHWSDASEGYCASNHRLANWGKLLTSEVYVYATTYWLLLQTRISASCHSDVAFVRGRLYWDLKGMRGETESRGIVTIRIFNGLNMEVIEARKYGKHRSENKSEYHISKWSIKLRLWHKCLNIPKTEYTL